MKRHIKRFSVYLSIITLGMLTLCGCSADDLAIDPESPQPPIEYSGEKVTMYFSFNLSMVNGAPSRADDSGYDVEDEQNTESKVKNLLIFFYDAAGTCVGCFDSETFTKESVTETGVEQIGWKTLITVPVEVYKEVQDKTIDSFFAVVNYDGTIRDEFFTTGADGKKTTIPLSRTEIADLSTGKLTVEDGNEEFFVMTTPGHYDSSGNYLNYWKVDKKTDNSPIKGSDIIFKSKTEAIEHPVDVYVERLAARIELKEIKNNISSVEVLYGTDVYALTFVPLAWGVEAMEKTEYLAKHAPVNEDSYDDYYPDEFYGWLNYTDAPRCFWAESPVYKNYSDVSSTTTNTYPATGSEIITGLSLNYIAFSDIDLNEEEFKTKKYKGHTYITERTFSASELKSSNVDNPYAVPTSFVLKGKYAEATRVGTDEKSGTDVNHDGTEIHGNQAPEALSFNDAGFYLRDIDMERTDKEEGQSSKRYRYRLYREDNGAESGLTDDLFIALTKEQHMIFVESEETFPYLDENGEQKNKPTKKFLPVKETTTYSRVEPDANQPDANQKYVNKTYTIKAEDIFEIVNTYQYWTGKDWISASNTFTLQLKSTPPAGVTVPQLYYADYDEDTGIADYIPITAETDKTTANEELQKQLGYARKYHNGMAFFFSPITHYTGEYAPFQSGYKGLFNYEIETKDGKTSYKKDTDGKYIPNHKTGDFGVVRNHIYSFTIDGIASLGYGIPDEDVIPLPEPQIEHDIYFFDIELKILPWNLFEYTLDI